MLPPWVVQEIEEEERRQREEDERARSNRIELPQLTEEFTEERSGEARPPVGGVLIVDISPRDDSFIDL